MILKMFLHEYVFDQSEVIVAEANKKFDSTLKSHVTWVLVISVG